MRALRSWLLWWSLLTFGACADPLTRSDTVDGVDTDTTDTTDTTGADRLGLPPESEAVFSAVTTRYSDLEEAHGHTAARSLLLAELATFVGVDRVALASDQTSFTLTFAAGGEAVLLTDEDSLAVTLLPRRAMRALPTAPSMRAAAPGSTTCGDRMVAPSRKVHIVNLAGGSNPESKDYPAEIESYLVSLGWDPDEVDITQRASYLDRDFALDDILDQEGYGLVLFIGHGGIRVDAVGEEHFILQGFLGGQYADGWQDRVEEPTWDEWKGWYEAGELVTGRAMHSETDEVLADVYIRDDRLGASIALDPGALVSFVSCNSVQASAELLDAGAGAVLAWDNSVRGSPGIDALKAVCAGLVDPELGSVEATLAHMVETGEAFSDNNKGTPAQLRLADQGLTWSLPAGLTLWAADACVPTDADRVELALHFPDCPENDRTLTLAPGETLALDGLVPGAVEVSARAIDASGRTLAASLQTVALEADQVVSPDLCPCEGDVALDLSAWPQDGPFTTASIEAELTYADATLGAMSFALTPTNPMLSELIPGPATVELTARSATGELLATATVEVEARCDETPRATACFGWVQLVCDNPPADTATLTVTAPTMAHAIPPTRTFAPGDSAFVYGFALGEVARFDAVATNALGVEVGRTSFAGQVGCGPTTVEVDFDRYALRVTAAPTRRHADGLEAATVTVVARQWRTDDLLEPTGDLLADKAIELDTSCGRFTGPSSGVTDGEGRLVTTLVSDEPCLAVVRAFALDDGVESPPTFVNFDKLMAFWIDGSTAPASEDRPRGVFAVSCLKGRFYLRDTLMGTERLFAREGLFWGFYFPAAAQPGDELRFEFEAYSENEECQGGAEHAFGPIYVQTAYAPDYVHQRAYTMSGRRVFTGSVTVRLTLDEIDHYAP